MVASATGNRSSIPRTEMSDLWEALWTALRLLLRGDPALWQIIGLSLGVSGAALLISSVCLLYTSDAADE